MPAPEEHPDLEDLDCSEGGQMSQLIHRMYGSQLIPTVVQADQLKGHKGSVWHTDMETDEFKTPGMQEDGWSSSPLYPDVDDGIDGFGFGSGKSFCNFFPLSSSSTKPDKFSFCFSFLSRFCRRLQSIGAEDSSERGEEEEEDSRHVRDRQSRQRLEQSYARHVASRRQAILTSSACEER
jgi:hypothetical protein